MTIQNFKLRKYFRDSRKLNINQKLMHMEIFFNVKPLIILVKNLVERRTVSFFFFFKFFDNTFQSSIYFKVVD